MTKIMNKITVKILSGYTILILMIKSMKSDDECIFLREKNTVDCTDRRLETLPNYVDKDIKILILTASIIDQLHADSFQNYSKLDVLTLTQSKIGNFGHPDFLKFLTRLRILNMDGIYMKNIENINWPPGLEELSLSETNLTNFNATNELPKLKRLILKANKLKNFPRLNKLSPLEFIDLDLNPIKIYVEDVAPFCYLKNLRANTAFIYADNSNITSDCSCYNLKYWLENFTITNNIRCPRISEDINCKKNNDKNTLASHSYLKCEKRRSPSWFVKNTKFIISVIFPILASISAYFVYRVLKSGLRRFKGNQKKGKKSSDGSIKLRKENGA